MGFIETFKQWQFEPALRIQPGATTKKSLDELIDAIERLLTTGDSHGDYPPDRGEISEDEDNPSAFDPLMSDEDTIKRFATSLWRIDRQAQKLGDEGRVVKRRMEDLLDQLEQRGLIIEDFSETPWRGEQFDAVNGKYEETEIPIINSMLEPRIRYKGEMLQLGAIMLRGEPKSGET
ncbi:MAG: hypothetical protein AAF420_08140 [Pseudomonadota bacterium]